MFNFVSAKYVVTVVVHFVFTCIRCLIPWPCRLKSRERFLASSMSFTSFAGAMALVSKTDTNGKFFLYCVKVFCGRYAEGAYYDAAVWGRRAAEVYCLVLLGLFQYDLQDWVPWIGGVGVVSSRVGVAVYCISSCKGVWWMS